MHSLPSCRNRYFWLSFIVAVALIAGCATRRQVEDAVIRSNLAILSASGGLGTLNPEKGGGADWREAAAKLENLIAENSDNPSMLAALRLRQAMLYLQAKQFHLARAAFAEVKADALHTSRDRALINLREPLLWWYAASEHPFSSRAGSDGRNDFIQATNALRSLSVEWARLNSADEQGIRDYLAAMRAFIGVKLANDTVGASAARNHLTNTLNAYSAMLPPGETERWLNVETNWPPKDLPREVAILPNLRRRFEADALLQGARAAISNNNIAGPFNLTNAYLLKGLGQ